MSSLSAYAVTEQGQCGRAPILTGSTLLLYEEKEGVYIAEESMVMNWLYGFVIRV